LLNLSVIKPKYHDTPQPANTVISLKQRHGKLDKQVPWRLFLWWPTLPFPTSVLITTTICIIIVVVVIVIIIWWICMCSLPWRLSQPTHVHTN